MYNPNLIMEVNSELYLKGGLCEDCGKYYFPKTFICHYCGSKNVKEVPLAKKGKLTNYAISLIPLPGFTPPYAFGYVALEKERIKVFGPLTEYKDLDVGIEMELTFEKITWLGKEMLIHKFRPKR